jgi:hypothetical protein
VADIDWVILSELSIVEKGTSKLSVLGISEGVQVKRLPFLLPKLCVNLRLIGDAQEVVRIGLTLIAPDGSVMANADGQAVFGPVGSGMTYVAFKGIRFTQAGLHEIRISLAGVPLKSASFIVFVQEDQGRAT